MKEQTPVRGVEDMKLEWDQQTQNAELSSELTTARTPAVEVECGK